MQVIFEKVDDKTQEMALIKATEKDAGIQSAIEILENGAATLSVMKDDKTYLLKVNAVYYIESVDKRTYIYSKESCYESKLRLYELEEILGPFFARCSKAMIVNLRKLKSVNAELGGRMNAELLNGERIVIARSYVKEIKRRLEI